MNVSMNYKVLCTMQPQTGGQKQDLDARAKLKLPWTKSGLACRAKRNGKTYNEQDSHVVTHRDTNCPSGVA